MLEIAMGTVMGYIEWRAVTNNNKRSNNKNFESFGTLLNINRRTTLQQSTNAYQNDMTTVHIDMDASIKYIYDAKIHKDYLLIMYN